MDAIWRFLQDQIERNQIFTGGLILMTGGAIFAYCRQIPGQLWSWLRGLWVIEIDVLDRDAAFDWIDQWLAQHTYARRHARWLTVRTRPVDYNERLADPNLDVRPRILFTPAPGQHYLFYRGRLMSVHRERPAANQGSTQPVNVRESFSITIYSRDRQLAQKFLEDCRDVALPQGKERLTIYRSSYASWDEQMQRLPRPPESVVLSQGQMESLIDDAKAFLQRRDWYLERGLPYRRGYLLHGPPGTGKSSAVLALASALRMDLALLSLSGSSLDDNELGALLSQVPANAIVLIEDIDCAFQQRKESADKVSRLTFSGLLNALDGVAAGEGRMLFATTNHPEKLDPALIRPGRIDRKFEIGLADRDQLRRIFERFFPEADPAMGEYFAELCPEGTIAMSTVQTHLIRYSQSAEEAVSQIDELLAESRTALPSGSQAALVD